MNCPIYILAEGKSSRMGTDKGLVQINDQEMVLHCIENLKPLNQEIIIITSNHEYKKFGCRIISDKLKNQGPAQGIITALEDCKTEQCIIVSCDMPLVNDLLIAQLDNLIINSDIVCYAADYLYPFPALYSKSILPKWKQAVDASNLKMQSLIKQFNYKTLPIEDPDLFLNANTPEDIQQVETKLK